MKSVVVPYIKTLGTEKFKKFLDIPFNVNLLDTVMLVPYEVATLFSNWKGKNMGNWYKFISDDNTILEFYSDHYFIKGEKRKTQQLPLPTTLNEFINDMSRLNVELVWSDWIDENFEPKDYLPENEIKAYFVELLGKMDKSQELI